MKDHKGRQKRMIDEEKKKRGWMFLLILSCIMMTAACAGKGEEKMNTPYITEKELITIADLALEDYEGVDLGQFIRDYELTEENIGSYPIKLLLAEYTEIGNMVNMEYLFEDEYVHRNTRFTEDVTYVACYENKGTDVRCVLYDCIQRKKYVSEGSFLFTDIKAAEAADCTKEDISALLERLDQTGVFEWKSVIADDDGLSDAQTMELVAAYTDGSFFKVSISGILHDLVPENYSELMEQIF